MLLACSYWPASIRTEFPVTGLGVKLLKYKASLQLNGLFSRSWVYDRFEGNQYQCADMMFFLFDGMCIKLLDVLGMLS